MSDERLRELERAYLEDPSDIVVMRAWADERARQGLEQLPAKILGNFWRPGKEIAVSGRPMIIVGLEEFAVEVALPTTPLYVTTYLDGIITRRLPRVYRITWRRRNLPAWYWRAGHAGHRRP